MYKIIAIISFITMMAGSTLAQEFRGLDKSPLDHAYLPDNFAHDRKPADKAIIRVTYSRPQKKNREVFGGIVNYDNVWRLGANEATEIKVYKDVKIGGKPLKMGTYSMFAIPKEKGWTIIINSDLDFWGHYSYLEAHDVLRVEAIVKQNAVAVEALSIQFAGLHEGEAVMKIAWDKTIVELPITY